MQALDQNVLAIPRGGLQAGALSGLPTSLAPASIGYLRDSLDRVAVPNATKEREYSFLPAANSGVGSRKMSTLGKWFRVTCRASTQQSPVQSPLVTGTPGGLLETRCASPVRVLNTEPRPQPLIRRLIRKRSTGSAFLALAVLVLSAFGWGAEPSKRIAVDPSTRVSAVWAGGALRLDYTVSAPSGTVRVYAAEQLERLQAAESLLYAGPVPASGVGSVTVSDWQSQAARFFSVTWDAEIPNPDPAQWTWIAPGHFLMGSPASESDRGLDEGPQMATTLSRGFFMGRHEVTQGDYAALMGANPSCVQGDPRLPVEQVTLEEAQEYCERLTSRQVGLGLLPPSMACRLPTEAEWEFAARANTTMPFSYGEDPGYALLSAHAWYVGNSEGQSHVVGGRQANPWGLYDMYGNVWE